MDRKKFFTSISLGAIGFTVLNSFPMNLISKRFDKNKPNIKVKINPDAVSRKKIGNKNV
jgi:hypothetical protein